MAGGRGRARLTECRWSRAFYLRPARTVARDLLGCVLVSRRGGTITSGRIVETEAYLGPDDAASHAAFRPGSRALFYGPGGIAYVYQAYGLHDCLNAIAGRIGQPGCVLIRALEPLEGAGVMARRRGCLRPTRAGSPADPATSPERSASAGGTTGADLIAGPLTIEPRRRLRPPGASPPARVSASRAPPRESCASGSPVTRCVSQGRRGQRTSRFSCPFC